MIFRKKYWAIFLFLLIGKITYSQLILNKGFALTNSSFDGNNSCEKIDAGQNCFFISGMFSEPIDFDPDTSEYLLTPAFTGSQSNAYFAAYDHQSNLKFAKNIGGNGCYIFITDQVIDADNNLYLVGYFHGSINMEPTGSNYMLNSVNSNLDVFFTKYDSTGQLIWANRIGSNGSDVGWKISLDQFNNVYVAGHFNGTMDFNPSSTATNNLITLNGSKDAFIAKYDEDGNYVWAIPIQSNTNYDNISSMYISDDNFIYLVGEYGSSVDFDFGTDNTILISNGAIDGFIAKYDLSSNFIWVKSIECAHSFDVINHVISDSNNNLYIVGQLYSSIDLDPDTTSLIFNDIGDRDTYLACYTQDSCQLNWAKRINGNSNAIVAGLDFKLDSQSSLYLSGRFEYPIDFDPSLQDYIVYPGNSNNNSFLCKFDSLGNLIWVNTSSGADYSHLKSFSIYQDTLIFASFLFNTSFDLDFSGDAFNINAGLFNTNGAIGIYNINDCGNVSIQIDSLTDLTCSVTTGVINTTVFNAASSSQLEWDSNPAFFGDDLTISENGIYILTYSDSTNCSLSRSVLVEGPDNSGNFDLRCNLIANFFRPGINGSMIVTGYNTTCDSLGGTIQLIMDNRVQFDSAFIQPDYISGDTLRWNIQDLVYGNNFETLIYYTSDTTLIFTDTVCFHLEITPITGDQIPANNTLANCYPVTASYDPNFKQVTPKGDGIDGLITNNLLMNYTIHFQNTGSAEAIDIYILDTISTNLNMHTIEITENSHDVTTEILFPGNIIKFKFDEIHLPDSMNNEPESHGYVSYQIYQVPNLTLGETIKNTCYIYFDYNEPVKTNEVSNKIGMEIVSTAEFEFNEGHTFFYPNPVADFINFNLSEKSLITIFNSMGQIVYENNHSLGENSVNLQTFSNGLYILKINNSTEKSCQKIIKY